MEGIRNLSDIAVSGYQAGFFVFRQMLIQRGIYEDRLLCVSFGNDKMECRI